MRQYGRLGVFATNSDAALADEVIEAWELGEGFSSDALRRAFADLREYYR